MKLINTTSSTRVVKVGTSFISLEPNIPSAGLILGLQDIINIRNSAPNFEVKFVVTNPMVELDLLSSNQVPEDYLYNGGE